MAHEGTRRAVRASCSPQYMPFDLVIDEQTAWGEEARVTKTSVCGSWGADRRRAALLRRPLRQSARVDRGDAAADGRHPPLRDGRRGGAGVRRRAPEGAARAASGAWSTSASSWSARSRRWTSSRPAARTRRGEVLAEALARGEARHFAVKNNLDHDRRGARGVPSLGGALPRLGQAELAALYEAQARRA